MEYVLQSTIEEIANSFIKQNYGCKTISENAAKYLVKYCPKELYPCIDEMVKGVTISDIPIILPIRGTKRAVYVNQIKNDFYNKPSLCCIMLAIAKKNNDENGFGWLADICGEE